MVIAIALGALGAHYLKENLELPADKLDSWKTGVFYQITHSLGIFIVILLATTFKIDKVGAIIKIFILIFNNRNNIIVYLYYFEKKKCQNT